jgi:hypothetical protein
MLTRFSADEDSSRGRMSWNFFSPCDGEENAFPKSCTDIIQIIIQIVDFFQYLLLKQKISYAEINNITYWTKSKKGSSCPFPNGVSASINNPEEHWNFHHILSFMVVTSGSVTGNCCNFQERSNTLSWRYSVPQKPSIPSQMKSHHTHFFP